MGKVHQVILLTASVSPNGMTHTAIQDPYERLNQYRASVNWYLANTKIPIVLCENTNASFPKGFFHIPEDAAFECLTFGGNDYPRELGKGYGEGQILKFAFEHSSLLRNAQQVIKITGRTIVGNIRQVIRWANHPDHVYAQRHYDIQRSESRLFVASHSFFTDELIPNISRINDSKEYYFESLLFDLQGPKGRDFPFPIRFEGMSGTSGKPLSPPSQLAVLKLFLKNLCR